MGIFRQTPLDLAEDRRVVEDHLALELPLGGHAEQVPAGATQALAFRQQPEDGQHPGAEADLAWMTRGLVAEEPGKGRRREVKLELVVPVEGILDRLLEAPSV